MVQRSPNSHRLKKRAFPFVARMRREEPFRSADAADWQATADRIAGGSVRWYAWAPSTPGDVGSLMIGFASQTEADKMQTWIAASGIETRPAPGRYDGPQLTVAHAKPS